MAAGKPRFGRSLALPLIRRAVACVSSEIAQNLPALSVSHDAVDRTGKLKRDWYYLPKN